MGVITNVNIEASIIKDFLGIELTIFRYNIPVKPPTKKSVLITISDILNIQDFETGNLDVGTTMITQSAAKSPVTLNRCTVNCQNGIGIKMDQCAVTVELPGRHAQYLIDFLGSYYDPNNRANTYLIDSMIDASPEGRTLELGEDDAD